MLTKIYAPTLSASAILTFAEIISAANVDALMNSDQEKMADISELYRLYAAAVDLVINCDHPSATEWQD